MANIQSNLNKIKNAVLGVDVRDSIHDGIKAINEEVENTTDRQVQLEGTFDELVINAGNSNAEVAAARVDSTGKSHGTLGKRLNNFDSQIKDIGKNESGIFNVDKLRCEDENCIGECGKLKGDGVHDDTSAFEYIFSNIRDEIRIPKGIYKIARKLVIPRALKIEGMGCSYAGTVFNFYDCSGFEIKQDYVFIKDLAILLQSKPNFTININNKEFGTIGVKFTFNDSVTSSSCSMENVIINGFHVGIATYEEGNQTWAGAYREFKKISLVENEINYFSSGVTHDKFIGSNINRASKHPIYCTSKGEPSNVEFIATTIDGNRNVETSIVADTNTKINISNCYIEYLDIKSNNNGSIRINNSHIDPGVRIFGRGTISLNECWGDYKAIYKCDFLTDRWYANDVTLSDKEKYKVRLSSDISSSLKFLTGYVPLKNNLKIKDIQSVKISYDYKIISGHKIDDFNNKIGFRIVDTDGNTTYINTQSIIDDFAFDGKNEGKFECYYNFNRITDSDKLIDKLLFDIKISDALNGDGYIDFSTTNLNMVIKNVTFTVYSNSELVTLNDVVNQTLIENDYNAKINKKANLDRYTGIINSQSNVKIKLNDNNYEARLCMLSVTKSGDTNTGVDIVALVYASPWCGTLSEIVRKQRTTSECSISFSISNNTLTITNNNNFNVGYALRDCFKL